MISDVLVRSTIHVPVLYAIVLVQSKNLILVCNNQYVNLTLKKIGTKELNSENGRSHKRNRTKEHSPISRMLAIHVSLLHSHLHNLQELKKALSTLSSSQINSLDPQMLNNIGYKDPNSDKENLPATQFETPTKQVPTSSPPVPLTPNMGSPLHPVPNYAPWIAPTVTVST
jgi:hypothetical protein